MAVVNSSRFNLEEAIKEALNSQYDDAVEAITEIIPKVANEAVNKLKRTSPKGATGKYAKGWKCKIETGRMRVGATIYGESGTYQLAHLLEKSHAKRGGGRTNPIPHIEPVERWAIQEASDRLAYRLENGGGT